MTIVVGAGAPIITVDPIVIGDAIVVVTGAAMVIGIAWDIVVIGIAVGITTELVIMGAAMVCVCWSGWTYDVGCCTGGT